MAGASKSTARGSAKSRSGSKGLTITRDAKSGKLGVAAVKGKAGQIVIPVKKKTMEALTGKRKLAAELLAAYGDALVRSRDTGRPVGFVVNVDPGGSIKTMDTRMRDPLPAGTREPERAPSDRELERALATARERGRGRVAEILGADDMLSADDFADLVGTTRVTVNTWRQNRQVLGLEGATRGFKYPAWQVGRDGKPYEALPALFGRFGDSAWAVYRFLVQHHPELDGLTGREALERGRADEVIAAADSVAQAFA